MSSRTAIVCLCGLGSGLGFMTQVLVSGFWASAFSEDIFYFSANVAFYFLSLGIGGLLGAKWRQYGERALYRIVLVLCLWVGLAVPLLRLGIALTGGSVVCPVGIVTVAGLLAGTLIPIATSVRGRRVDFSTLLFFEYASAIVISGLFTHVLLVPLGYGRTGATLAVSATSLVFGGLVFLSQTKKMGLVTAVTAVLAAALPFPSVFLSSRLAEWFRLPGDTTEVIYQTQSHYQKIVLTKEKGTGSFFPDMDQYVLYLDGMVQFTSLDEQSYHTCLSVIPETAAEYVGNAAKTVLILGGGDGLAARNLLSLPRITKVTQVEIDPEMIRFSSTHPVMRQLNLDSLKSPRLELVLEDAFTWVKEQREPYDIVVVDFPHARNVTLARLYTAEFYSRLKRLVKADGFVAIQAGPSIDYRDPTLMSLPEIPVCIRDTVRAVGFNAHLYVSTRDEEAFVLATPNPKFDMSAFAKRVGILGLEGMGLVCSYNPAWKEPEVQVNTLNTLSLLKYMQERFRQARSAPFFAYQGIQLAFLPE